jgi:SnoaL-like domain
MRTAWDPCRVPWLPELFSEPVLQEVLDRRRRKHLASVPFFDGLISGDLDALLGSFAGEPELHHPVRGRIKGTRAFERFVADYEAWVAERNVTVEDVNLIRTSPRGVEEDVLHIDSDDGRIALPLAVAADHDEDDRIIEFRIYFSTWPLTGCHANRPPLLQSDPDLREPDVVGEYQRALAEGDVDGAVAAFEPDGSVREPAGAHYYHRGTEELRALYERFFSNGGGIPLEHCAVTDDGRACALEYNVVRWGRTKLPPEAGIAVYVRGPSGKLATAHIYDDSDPPVSHLNVRRSA